MFWVTGFAVPGNRIRVSMDSDRFCGSKKPGSGHQGSGFRRLRAPRVRRLRCSMGSDGLASVPWTELVLGTGFRNPRY